MIEETAISVDRSKSRIREILISLVVPVFNETQAIDPFLKKISTILDKTSSRWEMVFINDGSSDETLETLLKHQKLNKKIRILDFSRNFGKEAALSAGLKYAKGDVVIPIDVDLQDPPEIIPKMIAFWREGYDVVLAIRRSRDGDSFIKRITASLFYIILNKISEISIPRQAGDYRLLDRRVVNILNSLQEKNRFMKGLFAWVGFKTTHIMFDRKERQNGETSFNYLQLLNFGLNGITAFSSSILRFWTYVGCIVFGYGFCSLFLEIFLTSTNAPSYILPTITILAGIQILAVATVGEYVSKIYNETKQRPLYVIQEIYEGTVET